MIADLAKLSPRERYSWMIASIVPRPIALTSTISREGVTNVAPFSFFNGVCADPPLVSLALGRRRDGSDKDTLRNARDQGELVINLTSTAMARAVVDASTPVSPEQSEFDLAGFTAVPSTRVLPPRVAEAKLSMECRTHRILEVGAAPNHLILAEILVIHADEAILVDGLPDPARLDPLARLGGACYAGLNPPFEVPPRR